MDALSPGDVESAQVPAKRAAEIAGISPQRLVYVRWDELIQAATCCAGADGARPSDPLSALNVVAAFRNSGDPERRVPLVYLPPILMRAKEES